MPAISHVLLNNIFNPSFPTKKWKKLSFLFFFWKKCKFLRDHFCRGQSSAELMVVSRFFLPQSCQLYFRGNLFLRQFSLQPNGDVKLVLISGKSVYLSEHFPQYFKVRKIKMQQKVNGDFFGQKISDFGDF